MATRIALLSDIHGNAAALDAALAEVRREAPDIIAVLGDLALNGPRPGEAVDRVREAGIPVIALKMAGSVPDHADLVVTDPIQAGVFAVMHISKKAVFDIHRVRGREF